MLTIGKRKIRYSFSFDLDTEKLEIYTGSKTKPYYEIRRYLTLELKFTHLKDTDYISDKLSFRQMYKKTEDFNYKFPYFQLYKKKFTIAEINENIIDGSKILSEVINRDNHLQEKNNNHVLSI
jgi:virulence-associated protein VapD